MSLSQIPVSIGAGILLGAPTGYLLTQFFSKFKMIDSVKALLVLSIAFLSFEVEEQLAGIVPLSGLIAIMSMGLMIKQKQDSMATRLSDEFNTLWIPAEIFLFVLVGATVQLKYALSAGWSAVLIIVIALIFRMAGVALSVINTDLTKKERLFCMLAYSPKATVQAAIGAIPLIHGTKLWQHSVDSRGSVHPNNCAFWCLSH